MRTQFDFSPLRRSAVGLDHLFDTLEAGASANGAAVAPAYDIEQLDPDNYRITLAVPGYSTDKLEIVAKQNFLTVSGDQKHSPSDRYLHKGIAAQPFEHRFMLGDYVQIRNATLADGLLTLHLQREIPEALKPRKINIGG
jgi:molecular chaperone IbpA